VWKISDKISINVKSIGLNVTHNFIIPSDMKCGKVVGLIAMTIKEEYPGTFFSKENNHFLVHEESGKMVNLEYNMKKLGVVNGERFILV